MLLTRLPLYLPRRAFSFDLHVLGTSPAFILSQDQTLRIKNFDHKTILIQTNFLNLYIKNYFKFGLLCMSKIITFRSLSFFQAPHQRSSKTSFYLLSHFFKVVKIYFSRNFIFFWFTLFRNRSTFFHQQQLPFPSISSVLASATRSSWVSFYRFFFLLQVFF